MMSIILAQAEYWLIPILGVCSALRPRPWEPRCRACAGGRGRGGAEKAVAGGSWDLPPTWVGTGQLAAPALRTRGTPGVIATNDIEGRSEDP